ncbi:hypothetical protein [Streptomyces sp. NPDC059701]|uniref:hypothetical protein n=1 Tax=Streptomyces sp. NPDC059701 TaxID=3346914 RepID=UPI0036915AE1
MQRKGGRRRDAGEQDVEAVLDELYTTPPPDFVSRREERAAAARTAGRAQDARRIRAARRPTRAAWAANLLLRSRPEESRRFLELGQALREAHRTLDAAGLKELSAQRRSVVTALSRQAAQLAAEAGHHLPEPALREVEGTLRAVLADPDAAGRWADGRLEGSLTPPSDFPAGTAPAPVETARARQPSRPAAKHTPAGKRGGDELAERRRKRQEELARAQETAQAAERRADERRAARTDAEETLRRARGDRDRARAQVSLAERQLRAAREELKRAEAERRDAEERNRVTGEELSGAEREAREAARHMERLAARVRR